MLRKLSVACAFTAALAAAPALAQDQSSTLPPPTVTVKKEVAIDMQDNTKRNIVEAADKAGSFKTLGTALKAAGVADTLKGSGPFTVFAPTDEAFAKLPKGTLETLLKPENKEKLAAILKYHVIAGNVNAADVAKMGSMKSLQGESVNISGKGDSLKVNDAKVVTSNIACTNGVIHVIDLVLMPRE